MIVRDIEDWYYLIVLLEWYGMYIHIYPYIGNDIGYVRHDIQIVTITLLIHCCIPSTTYAITIYNVNNKQQKQ